MVFTRLGGWAIMKVGDNPSEVPAPTVAETVLDSGFFDEAWAKSVQPLSSAGGGGPVGQSHFRGAKRDRRNHPAEHRVVRISAVDERRKRKSPAGARGIHSTAGDASKCNFQLDGLRNMHFLNRGEKN